MDVAPPSKLEAEYWKDRLFKNTFTYKGRSREVKGWSIKIQLFGKRKTFALSSSDRVRAAAEACHIYQTIFTQGWDAVGQRSGRAGFRSQLLTQPDATAASVGEPDEGYWKRRLIHRPYPKSDALKVERELSVRIEHAGTSRYFPLHTCDEDQAAARANQIHRAVVHEGWAVAGQKYSRELTIALRWLDDPLAWTYTTFHTWVSGDPMPPLGEGDPASAVCNVAIVEPDAGIRYALAACTSHQEGFRCCGAWGGATEALREVNRQTVDLVLLNYSLPDQQGSACEEELLRAKPGLVGLLYSVYEDSDQLFKNTPGGATGYMLKRTSRFRLFDPLASNLGRLKAEQVAASTRDYFQKLVSAMPSGPSSLETARLTPREQEVLALLSRGEPAKGIADHLQISVWTVHGHVKNIFEKLNVHTRTEAVVKYLQK